MSLQFARLGVLCPDGRCKSFDEGANGYCRSEAVAIVFLQKLKDSRRIYARVVHAKTNCDGYKEQGITYPSGQMQQKLLEEFYEECEIKPSELSFVEAHGTGTKVSYSFRKIYFNLVARFLIVFETRNTSTYVMRFAVIIVIIYYSIYKCIIFSMMKDLRKKTQ